MQSLTQPTLLLKPFAESGDKNTIPVTNTDTSNPQLADLTNGFPTITSEDPDDGGLPPERKDINGLGYLTTTYDFFYQAGGTFTFNTTVSNAIGGYPLGAKLWYTDNSGNSTILTSTKANNQDNFITTPSYIGTSWKQELPFLSGNNTWTGTNNFVTPSASDNSTKAATTAWVNTVGNNVVHRTGNENIAGNKTFTGNLIGQAGVRSESSSASDTRTGFFIAENKRFSFGTSPSSDITTQYVVRGENDEWCGILEHLYTSSGANIMQLIARKQDKSGTAQLGVGYDSNGNAFAFAPTPSDVASNNTNIATTQFVHNFETTQKTNCFLNIPQDINLELSSGTLVLKAGSKIYVPNGSGTFNVVTTTTDATILPTLGDGSGENMVCVKTSYSSPEFWVWDKSTFFSGSTAPTGNQYMMWYDTNNNKVKLSTDSGSTWQEGYSLPIMVGKSTDQSWTSIEQTFNGVGYIGNTLFSLPGIKFLVPNGKYANGVLRNSTIQVDSVMTGSVPTTTGVGNYKIYLYGSAIGTYNTFIYDPETNKNYISTTFNPDNSRGRMLVGDVFVNSSNGKVSKINIEGTFNGVSWVDANNIVSNYLSSICNGNFKEKATLFQGPITSGNITLSRPYTDFDALLIERMGDNQETYWSTTIVTKYDLDTRRANTPTNGNWMLFDGQTYWICSYSSTTTSFVSVNNNSSIRAIYGINF